MVFLCLSLAAGTWGEWKWSVGQLAHGLGAGIQGEPVGSISRCVLFLPLEKEFFGLRSSHCFVCRETGRKSLAMSDASSCKAARVLAIFAFQQR